MDATRFGAVLAVLPAGRTATLVLEDEVLVATGSTVVDDDKLFALIGAGRRRA